jgi:adenosylhomocysteine nucleosidase
MPSTRIRLGIISALHQEQAGLFDLMQERKIDHAGMRDYVQGRLGKVDCVCVLSRIGKVAAAATVATLIERFQVSHIVFTGVAGAIDGSIRVGDIVLADSLVQHDMNAAPLFPPFEVPLLGLSHFSSHKALTERLMKAANAFIEQDFETLIGPDDRARLRLSRPRIHRGLIGSGDQFIHQRAKADELSHALPGLLAVEMEGAAVAQVCFEFGVPFAVIRTISDGSNEDSAMDFVHFIERIASPYALHIIGHLCSQDWES